MNALRNFFKTFKGDQTIWVIVILLSLFSAMAVYSSTSLLAMKNHVNINSFIFKHSVLILVAIGFMWVMHNIPYQYYSGLYKVLIPLSILALLYASFFGSRVNDAGRWINIPIINQTFQASDLAKFALILYLARHISTHQHVIKDFKKGFLPMLIMTFVFVFLIFVENISTSFMVLGTSLIMMYLGRVHIVQFATVLGILLLSGILMGMFLLNAPDSILVWRLKTGKSRIESFLDSKKKFNDVSYQVKQSNLAIARGGILPNGPGNSIQKNFLPNAFSDYVFAIIIEEWGLIGGIFLIFLYLALLFRVIVIMVKSPKTFGAMVALGLGLSIVIQAFMNMGVNVGIFPATGVTLPLVSMGGSSIIFVAMSLGIILAVSRSVENEELGQAPTKENYMDEVEDQFHEINLTHDE